MYNDILISLQEATVTLRVSKDLVVVMLKFVKTQRAPACRTVYIHLLILSPPPRKKNDFFLSLFPPPLCRLLTPATLSLPFYLIFPASLRPKKVWIARYIILGVFNLR